MKCPKCEKIDIYDEKHDAYYCKHCNQWLEKICADIDCKFCSNRQKRPLKFKKRNL